MLTKRVTVYHRILRLKTVLSWIPLYLKMNGTFIVLMYRLYLVYTLRTIPIKNVPIMPCSDIRIHISFCLRKLFTAKISLQILLARISEIFDKVFEVLNVLLRLPRTSFDIPAFPFDQVKGLVVLFFHVNNFLYDVTLVALPI